MISPKLPKIYQVDEMIIGYFPSADGALIRRIPHEKYQKPCAI
jgi:hypothetical protein